MAHQLVLLFTYVSSLPDYILPFMTFFLGLQNMLKSRYTFHKKHDSAILCLFIHLYLCRSPLTTTKSQPQECMGRVSLSLVLFHFMETLILHHLRFHVRVLRGMDRIFHLRVSRGMDRLVQKEDTTVIDTKGSSLCGKVTEKLLFYSSS